MINYLPFLPYLGLLSGGSTVEKHVVKHKTKDVKVEKHDEKNE